jgi:hypothetical protein
MKFDIVGCKSALYDVGFVVLTAVLMKSSVSCDITPRSPLKVDRRFGGMLSALRASRPPFTPRKIPDTHFC